MKIHLNDVAVEFAVAAPIVAMAAKGAVDIELQKAFLLADVEGNFFASLLEFVFGRGADGFADRESRFVGSCAQDLDGAPDVIDLERPMLDAGHGKRLLYGLLPFDWQVAVRVVELQGESGRRRKLHGKRYGKVQGRLRNPHVHRLGGQRKRRQAADSQHHQRARHSHGLSSIQLADSPVGALAHGGIQVWGLPKFFEVRGGFAVMPFH